MVLRHRYYVTAVQYCVYCISLYRRYIIVIKYPNYVMYTDDISVVTSELNANFYDY